MGLHSPAGTYPVMLEIHLLSGERASKRSRAAHYSKPGILHDLFGDRDVQHERACKAERASVRAID